MIVADTSLIAPCVLPGEMTEIALAVYRCDSEWVAPPLWRSEVRNVLATHMRLKGLSLALAKEAWRRASSIVDDTPEPAAADVLDLAHASLDRRLGLCDGSLPRTTRIASASLPPSSNIVYHPLSP